jgi:hypothetical protein
MERNISGECREGGGGQCLVNWKTCLRPRRLVGMGIKDIERFNKALRLS